MCGITGIYTNKNRSFEKDIKSMTDALEHRGPDSYGYHIDEKKGLYLGHRRLRIIDLSKRADQPMYSADKNIIIVFNGEIYRKNAVNYASTLDWNIIFKKALENLI